MNKFLALVSVTILLLSINADGQSSQNKQKQESQKKPETVVSINAGLRSDGELVQAKKPMKSMKQQYTPVRLQQGRMLTDSDINAGFKNGIKNDIKTTSQPISKKQKLPLPSPVPLPYPITGKKKGVQENKGVRNSHDKFVNQQTSYIKQIRLPLGAKCNKLSFPKNAVIGRLGKLQAVECVKGDITLMRGTTTFKSGFPRKVDKKLPKKIIKKGDLSDEMPEDLPAG